MSRYCIAKPLEEATAKDTFEFMRDDVSRHFGWPRTGAKTGRAIPYKDQGKDWVYTLKAAKMLIDKEISEDMAWLEEMVRQNDLLTAKVNLMESELNGLRSQMARATKLVTLYKRGANAMEYPKPTSTYQGVSGYERRTSHRVKVQLAV